jgi:hypothetical protein
MAHSLLNWVFKGFAWPIVSRKFQILIDYKKQEKRKLGPDGREFLYVPLKGSLSRSPFSGPWELPTTAGEEIWGSVSLLLLFIFFNIVACMKGSIWICFSSSEILTGPERLASQTGILPRQQTTTYKTQYSPDLTFLRGLTTIESEREGNRKFGQWILVLSPRQGLGYFKSAR